LRTPPLSRELENRVIDRFFTIRGTQSPPSGLLLVGIDEPSFQELRLSWPWPRRLHARLIDRLSAAGASLIVFDILFAEPSDPENDAALASAIKRAGNVLLAETIDHTNDALFSRTIKDTAPWPFCGFRQRGGLAMIEPDSDGVVRHFELQFEGAPTLPASALHAAERLDLPPESSGLIKFVGPARSIDTLSYSQILDDEHPSGGANPKPHRTGRPPTAGIPCANGADRSFPHSFL